MLLMLLLLFCRFQMHLQHQPSTCTCTWNKVKVLFHCMYWNNYSIKKRKNKNKKEVIDFLPSEGSFINIFAVFCLLYVRFFSLCLLNSTFHSLTIARERNPSCTFCITRLLQLIFVCLYVLGKWNDGLTDFLVEISISIFCYLVNDLSFVSLSFNNSAKESM